MSSRPTTKTAEQEYLARANSRLKRMSDALSLSDGVHTSEGQQQIAHIMSSVAADDFDANTIREQIKGRLAQAGSR